MARTKEQILCKMTSTKATNVLWLKCLTDLIALLALNILVGTGHMAKQKAGKVTSIATAISWIFWFLILYFHKNFGKRWLCIQRITTDSFVEQNECEASGLT